MSCKHNDTKSGGVELFADSQLRPLSQAHSQFLFSDSIQVADIIDWAVRQLGPSEVSVTSFSISEEFLRRLYILKQRGDITSITLVLDHKATQKTLKLWHFMAQVFDGIHISSNHSKVLLVKGKKGAVSAVTSQNLTRGNRIESYAITDDPAVFGHLSSTLSGILRLRSVPFSELYAGAAYGD